VTILSGTGGFTESSGAVIKGSSSPGSPGGAGVLDIVPEPASLVLMGTGLLGLLGYAQIRRARAPA
jgi:hypothetical protein